MSIFMKIFESFTTTTYFLPIFCIIFTTSKKSIKYMKKVIEVLEKEIQKKKCLVAKVIKEAGSVEEEGFEDKIFSDLLEIIEVSKKEFLELKKLEKIRRFINTLGEEDDKLNEKVVEKKKRGRPKKNA